MRSQLKDIRWLLLIGLVIRLFFIVNFHYISPDGTQYARLGENLLHQGIYKSGGSQFPDLIQPPLYPFLTGLLTLVFPSWIAGKIISLLFGLALIAVVYLFLLRVFPDNRTAWYSAALLTFYPAMVSVSSQVATESLYIFSVYCGLALFWIYLKKREVGLIVLVSLVWGLTFLTRPEGLVFFLFTGMIIVFAVFRRLLPASHALLYVLIFGLLFSAYATMNYRQLHRFTISPKLTFVQGHARLFRFFNSQNWAPYKDLDNIKKNQLVRYGLAVDNRDLAANALFTTDSATTILVSSGKPARVTPGIILAGIAHTAFKNIKRVFTKLNDGLLLPLAFLALSVIGLFKLRKSDVKFILFISAFCLPVFSFLLSHVEQRFLFTLIPLLVFLPAFGFRTIVDWISRLLERKTTIRSRGKIISCVVLTLLFLSTLSSYAQIRQNYLQKEYYYAAGTALKQEVGKERVTVAAVVPQAVYYADLNYCVLPFASLDKLFIYLKNQQAQYVLFEQRDSRKRPFDREKLDSSSQLKLIKEFKIRDNRFFLYRIV